MLAGSTTPPDLTTLAGWITLVDLITMEASTMLAVAMTGTLVGRPFPPPSSSGEYLDGTATGKNPSLVLLHLVIEVEFLSRLTQ